MFRYTVICEFENSDSQLADRWVSWLLEEHLQDVIAAGAESAELVKLDSEPLIYEVRYAFISREAFDQYENDHAPKLRAEGLKRFPLELGLKYRRTTGTVVAD